MSGSSLPASPTNVSATSLTLNTPAQAAPNAPITLVGTYQGNPQSLDYNFGAGWIQASSVSFSAGTFSLTVPAGVAAGNYTPQVRDHDDPSVIGTGGTFVVDPWTPATLATSPGAVAVFEFNANDPAIAVVASDSTVHGVENSLNPSQWLAATIATGGNPIVIANNSGADGKRRVLQFHATTINAGIYDPSTNWLSAGGVNGSAGSALVDLANSSDISASGSFTTIIALDINKSYDYAAGPLWGSLASPGPLQYAQIRYNGSNGEAGAQVFDSNLVGTNAQSTISAGWHVMTMIKSDDTITYRLDGQQIATAKITSTLPFTANDFMIGGGVPPATSASAGQENGVPPPYVGEFQAYSGVLAGSDLANAEKLAGNSIGLSLNPTVVAPLTISDLSAGVTFPASGKLYSGPLVGVQSEYINVTADTLGIAANTPNWFIYSGAGNDSISASSGANVLDGGAGSNWLSGGSGKDSFYLDDRGTSADSWSTIANFHAGDAATIWGINASDFSLSWQDGQWGAAGFSGLTLHAVAPGGATASVTLAGLTSDALSNGKLSVTFGTDATTGIAYTSIYANS